MADRRDPWSKYVASGVPKSAGQLPAQRKELRDLSAEEKYLFMEGLGRFQQIHLQSSKPPPESYYEIAGIHGMPYRKWPNESFNDDMRQIGEDGFCTHSSILFLTWHRPFLALFESKLYEHVNLIAAGISDRDGRGRYVEIAKKFRLPYWDWARIGRPIFPLEAIEPQSWWQGPPSSNSIWPQSGKYNPLHHAPIPDNADRSVLDYGRETVRYPNRPDRRLTPRQQQQSLWDAVKRFYDRANLGSNVIDVQPARNLSERVANILAGYRRYGPVCHNQYSFDKGRRARTAAAEIWGSLEDIHNTVHGIVGSGGHMGQIAVSSFDPIFWLHHCNIDRLFALWQGLHENSRDPETWVTPQAPGVTFMNAGEKDDDSRTELYPFKYQDPRDGRLKWYTSDDVHRTEDFNYTYPETDNLMSLAPDQRLRRLTLEVDRIYRQPADDIVASMNNDPNAGARMLPQARMVKTIASENIVASSVEATNLVAAMPEPQILLQESLEPEKPFLRDLATDNKFLDWIVNIKGEKHAFEGRYSVYVFLGAVQEDDVALWPMSPHFVGLFSPFGRAENAGCAKCQEGQREGLQVTGQIPLTVALMERYLAQLIPDLTPQNVVPYLQKELHWRVAVDQDPLDDRSQVPGLTVFVISNEVTVTIPPDELPVFAPDVTIHAEATTNRDGTGRGNGTGLAVGEEQ